ncbi:MAG: HEAT repeat domain-containing protein [Acidithiobacillus sp.]|uniref:HEAT repeat domain-containing protein n=1 Tax=Acidithiobacillus sp. TaxID=1872118 RepID=UPI0025C18FC8|nr:HEAT repeat domain-containing protein [Acidithiobacillus sp.]
MREGAHDPLPPWSSLELAARLHWALSPELPAPYRQALLREQWVQTRCYFARRADLTPAEVAHFCQDPDYVVRLCMAKRPDLLPEQVESLCRDKDPNVRYAVARNALLTPEQRQQLQEDADELVRQAAKKGPRVSQTRCRPGQVPLYR